MKHLTTSQDAAYSSVLNVFNLARQQKYKSIMSHPRQAHFTIKKSSPVGENSPIIMRKTFINSKSFNVAKMNDSTSPRTLSVRATKKEESTSDREAHKDYYKDYKGLYNADVSKFRDIINQNDISQVPFMSNLRKYSKSSYAKTRQSMLSPRFQEAIRPTTSSLTRKRIGDFQTKSSQLAPVFFRWHNKTGRNNLWSTEFECSLRDYGDQYNPEEKKYDSLRKPIEYIDFEPREFHSTQLVCPRQLRSFRIKKE